MELNELSWVLYWIDVLGNAQGVILGLCMAMFIVGVVSAMFVYVEGVPVSKSYFVFGITAFVVLAFVGAVIPSKQTMHAILASEIGEKVIATELGEEAQEIVTDSFKVVRQYLDAQLEK